MSPKVFLIFHFDDFILFIFWLIYVQTKPFCVFPQTLNDVTEIYMKHSAGHNEPTSETAQNIIVDVISYFFQRAQNDKRSTSSNVDDKSCEADTKNDDIQEDTGCEMDGSAPAREEVPADNAHVDADGTRDNSVAHDDGSGNTVVIPRSSNDCKLCPR